jgi:hypothetical protein
MLMTQQPLLASHVLKKHNHAGKALFEDANAWVVLAEIFGDVLQDPRLRPTYLIIDALDECVTDLPKLLIYTTLSRTFLQIMIVIHKSEAYLMSSYGRSISTG